MKGMNLEMEGLTVIGKIQIVKTFIIPIFLYRASLMSLY